MASTAATDVRLVAGAVQVWRFAIDGGLIGAVSAVISLDEQERAGRLRVEADRSAFLASRSGLRVILGHHLDTDPAAIRFACDGRGKPSVVDGGDLTFSSSRSRPMAVVAVTRGRAIGVDVERIRPGVDIDAVARQLLSPAEAEALRATPEPRRMAAFFACWTRKEAMVKATGAGFGDGLAHVPSDPDDGGAFTVRSFDAGPGTAAAVAVEGPMGAISVSDLAPLGLRNQSVEPMGRA